MVESTPTRQRLIDEGMRLFAEQGFRATTVGDIEAAAGLQPRRGGLYKHFASKQDLLEAAVQSHLDRAAVGAAAAIDLAPLTGAAADDDHARASAVAFGAWFLAMLDATRDLTRMLEHDGQRMAELTTQVKRDSIDLSCRAAADVFFAGTDVDDPTATAIVALGALVALRRTTWTYGSPPLDIDDDRILHAWADVIVRLAPPSGE